MKRTASIALALLTMLSVRPAHATGWDIVFDYVSGGRWHTDRPDSLVVGGGHYVGYDIKYVAAGLATHFFYSPSFGGDNFAAELGGYFRWNFVNLELDRHVNIKTFVRFDGYYRTATRNYTDGFVPYLHLGLRVGGVELTTGGALETLQGGKVGGMLIWSLGFDVVELVSTISHLSRQGTPQPP